MEIFRRLEDFPARFKGGAVSIGKFDGLHRGHAAILERVTSQARKKGAPSVVFTFDPSPAQILRPCDAPCALCVPELKIELLERAQIDALILFPTTREFLAQTPTEFFQRVVVDALGATSLIEGANFCFGRDRSGDLAATTLFCASHGIDFEVVPSVSCDGNLVSSSAIRTLILDGDVARASAFLGRPYRLRGIVDLGDQRGRTLGYPTANLGATTTVLPAPGVYATTARTEDGRVYASSVNVGGNPTFGIEKLKIEAHLLDFSGNLYGRRLDLDFLEKIRDVKTFDSKEALLEQIRRDLSQTREIVTNQTL